MTYAEYLQSKKSERSNILSSAVSLQAILTTEAIPADNIFRAQASDPHGVGTFVKRVFDAQTGVVGRPLSPGVSFFTDPGFTSQLRTALSQDGDGDLYPEGSSTQELNTGATRFSIALGGRTTSGTHDYANIVALSNQPQDEERQTGTDGTTGDPIYTTYYFHPYKYSPRATIIGWMQNTINTLDTLETYFQEFMALDPAGGEPIWDLVDAFGVGGVIDGFLNAWPAVRGNLQGRIDNAPSDPGAPHERTGTAYTAEWAYVTDMKTYYENSVDPLFNGIFTSAWSASGEMTAQELWRLIIRARAEKPTGTLVQVTGLEGTIAGKKTDGAALTTSLQDRGIPLSEILPTPTMLAAFYVPENNADGEITHTTNNLIILAPAHSHRVDIYRASAGILDFMVDPSEVETQWSSMYTTTAVRTGDISNAIKPVWKEIVSEGNRGNLYWYRAAAQCNGSVPPLGAPEVPGSTQSLLSPIFKNDSPYAGVVTGVKEIRNAGLASRIEFSGQDVTEDLGVLRGGFVMFDGVRGVFQVAATGGETLYVFPALEESVSSVSMRVTIGIINSYSLPEPEES
ncbi:MAG: hypothetical protein LC687_04125 [Actinobacteria bacterium]|nr:hypothetical protein [Actinomycetota bacterium]MCA1807022.1 hypothetical protein [Actinomycetota bacterium]